MEFASKYLNGKKLLLLGGGTDMIGVTKLAQSMGCTVHVMDYYDTLRSPAKLVADVSSDISIFDTDVVVDYIKNNEIDGVMTGYSDSYLFQYLNICKQADLPYYGSEKAFGIATDKMLFKQACQGSGVGVIPGTNAYDYATVELFAQKNGYPLMIKPVDNSGSRGVIKCDAPEQLQSCYEYARSFSKTDNVIVERFMDCESIAIVYQLCGDKAELSAVCDRDTYHADADGSAITSGTLYPSKYLDRCVKETDEAIKRMLKNNGFRDGMVSLMAFVDEKGFYMCEMCYRPSGGHHFTLIDAQNGVNGLALLIEFAVTGKVDSYDAAKENPYFREVCGMIHIMGDPGKTIAKIDGVASIRCNSKVLDVCQELYEGQIIGKDGTTAQVLLSVWLKADDWDEFCTVVENIKSDFHVCDENGVSLVK